jgi:UDP-N-acetylglucosamine 2-epimerase (non-hydrolysing)
MKRIAVCVGGRPNYIKMAPIVRAIDAAEDLECVFVDAGQHYSPNMRDIFYDELGLRDPEFSLGVGSGGHAYQTSRAMTEMEMLLDGVLPGVIDAVLVHGDMNYALGCALAAVKLHIPVIHNEAGLRSFDRKMPEEINRILIDDIASIHFVTERSALSNLVRRCIYGAYMTGSTLPESIDYVCDGLPLWDSTRNHGNIVVTLHRPENVDSPNRLKECMRELEEIRHGIDISVKLYCHPRTQKRLDDMNYSAKPGNIVGPCGYKDFLGAMLESDLVITDSGGVQEETTILGIPCLTWRDSTERPVTCEVGTNTMWTGSLIENVATILESDQEARQDPKFWDGKASDRIVEILRRMK